MKYILTLILLIAAPAFAEGYKNPVQGILDMANAELDGRLQNKLAREAPPIKYQVETINKNPAPSYYGAAPSGGMDLGKLAEALKAAETSEPVEFSDSPFNDSFMPGLDD